MRDTGPRGTPVILFTFLLAALLQVIPLPEILDPGRPMWITMVLVYWVIALPHRVGVFWAFGVGLFQDVLTGTVLGQHALSLAVVAWLSLAAHKRLRVFPPLQQSVVMFMMFGTGAVLSYLVQDTVGRAPVAPLWALLPALVSAVIWRPVFGFLRVIRQRFGVR